MNSPVSSLFINIIAHGSQHKTYEGLHWSPSLLGWHFVSYHFLSFNQLLTFAKTFPLILCECSVSLQFFLVRDFSKKNHRDPSWFHRQLVYVLTLLKPSKSPQQVCNAGLGFFFTETCLTPHTQCICPGISSPFIHYIVSPYFLQQIICLQPSSYTDPLTPILKAGVIFVALIFRHWGSFKWGLSYFIPKLILTFFSEYYLFLLSS